MWKAEEEILKDLREGRMDIGVRCETCARDGHGPRHRECRDHWKELKKAGVRCWRPVGVILVWDNLEERG